MRYSEPESLQRWSEAHHTAIERGATAAFAVGRLNLSLLWGLLHLPCCSTSLIVLKSKSRNMPAGQLEPWPVNEILTMLSMVPISEMTVPPPSSEKISAQPSMAAAQDHFPPRPRCPRRCCRLPYRSQRRCRSPRLLLLCCRRTGNGRKSLGPGGSVSLTLFEFPDPNVETAPPP